jgi:hypothetical protein
MKEVQVLDMDIREVRNDGVKNCQVDQNGLGVDLVAFGWSVDRVSGFLV